MPVATIKQMFTVMLGFPTPILFVAYSDIVLFPVFIITASSSGFFLKTNSKIFSLGTNSIFIILLYYSDKTITFDGTLTMYSKKTDKIYSVLYKGHTPFITPRAKNWRIKVKKKVEFIAVFACAAVEMIETVSELVAFIC